MPVVELALPFSSAANSAVEIALRKFAGPVGLAAIRKSVNRALLR